MKVAVYLFSVVIVFLSSANMTKACDTPEKTVIEFINRDFRGERLSHKTSAEIDKLEVDNQFEPAWDVVIVATDYRINSIKVVETEAVVAVSFSNSWDAMTKFGADNVRDEVVEFHLRKTADCWKIAPPYTMPRVNPRTFMRHLRELYEENKKENNKEGIVIFDKQISELSKYIKLY